uniref:EGF-like domain-containing protein n=1 Tax=Clytia hemisphaerica TaxID=252671 RepID=A0A7M6DKF6_9CNID|eukprot:TCONS_00068857-protein
MAMIRFSRITLVWMLALTTGTKSQDTCEKAQCKQTFGSLDVIHGSLVKVSDKKFALWTASKTLSFTGSQEERERSCSEACVKEGKDVCRSAHLEAFQSEDTPSTCELFAENVYDHLPSVLSTIRTDSPGWTSFHVLNSFCEDAPCQNIGKCVPDFATNQGVCECTGYSGKFCQDLDPLEEDGSVYFTFDDGQMKNLGRSGDVLTEGTGDGLVIYDIARNTRVLQCNLTNCFDFGDATSTKCLKDFSVSYCAGGMTLAFWVRLLRGGEDRDGYVLIVGQGSKMSDTGIVINVKPYRTEVNIYIKLSNTRLKCQFTNIPNDIYRQWFFLSMSYQKTPEKKMVCFMNEDRVEVPASSTSASNPPASKFFPGDEGKFMLDDILYIPKFSTDEIISSYYNKTKTN